MTSKGAKKVYLFGGSFNPPHIGHVEICRHLFERKGGGEIWVIPCYMHPFGKELAPFEDRLNMCRLAFKEFGDKVRIMDVEKNLGDISFTVKTIEYLRKKFPGKGFILIVGADVAGEKGDWREFDRIQKLAGTVEIPRGKDSPITDISSTDIRKMISEGKEIDEYVLDEVAEYIVEHQLYNN